MEEEDEEGGVEEEEEEEEVEEGQEVQSDKVTHQEVSGTGDSVCYTGFLYFFEMFDLISDK